MAGRHLNEGGLRCGRLLMSLLVASGRIGHAEGHDVWAAAGFVDIELS